MTTTVIVGASIGGVRTAQALRSEGYQGQLVLIGAEHELPYDKPQLSKALLAGSIDRAAVSLLSAEGAAAAGITMLLGRPAQRLDRQAREVVLADGERVGYDTLVIATGSSPRPTPFPSPDGTHLLRTLADAQALREDLLDAGPVVIVGAGFIGSEVAATARSLGCQVTLVDPLPMPMGRLVGPELGALFGRLQARNGVHTCFGVGVRAIEGRSGDLRVSLTDGAVLKAGTVLIGIGARPNDGWLASSGIATQDGVLCDQCCRASAPDVYAVGDVARWWHPRHGRHVRAEHWTNAVEQAGCVAHNITHPHDPRSYAPVEYIWSDQYDWKIQFAGVRPEPATGEFVGDPSAEPQHFATLFDNARGELTGAVTVNWPRGMLTVRRLLAGPCSTSEARSQLEGLRSRSAAKRELAP